MTEFTWSGRTPASAVVHAVAAAEGRDPDELEPLAGSIDPDVLNTLFDPPSLGSTRDRRLVFRHAGYEVTVTGEGLIELATTAD